MKIFGKMKRILSASAVLCCACLLSVAQVNPFASKGKLVCPVLKTASVGDVYVISANPGEWNFSARVDEKDGKETLSIDLSLPVEGARQPAPDMKVYFSFPQVGVFNLWAPMHKFTAHLDPFWENCNHRSSLASRMPLYEYFDDKETNCLTIACSESFRRVDAKLGLLEEGCEIASEFQFFNEPEAPVGSYHTSILLDRRPVFWSESISEAAKWMMDEASLTPFDVPESAFDPLYSTWYQFHQGVTDKTVEAECDLASALGMKTIIVDDGWQTDDGSRGYAYCGDWCPTQNKFPDMAAHVARVQAKGMKYMLWYNVAYVGYFSRAYERFKGMLLDDRPAHHSAVLDPRFPQVREFIVNTYVRALREWKLDGFKLDFINSFVCNGTDPAIAQNYAGRDIKSVSEAVNVLMRHVSGTLRSIKPDIMLEFRQEYIGPAIRQYGNMFRASDCPGNAQDNRMRTANLRLTSGGTAVHADMLEWHPSETPENVSRTLISCIFSVIQYSVMLSTLPSSHKDVMKNWLDYSQKYRSTLLKAPLRPHHPECGFPLIEAVGESERIAAVYQPGLVVDLTDASTDLHILNASGSQRITLLLPAGKYRTDIIDAFGKLAGTMKISAGKDGNPVVLEIPCGGRAELHR